MNDTWQIVYYETKYYYLQNTSKIYSSEIRVCSLDEYVSLFHETTASRIKDRHGYRS
jgi:hypothetical protein